MPRKIIVGYDGRPQSDDALGLALLLAAPLDATVIAVTVGAELDGIEPVDRARDLARRMGRPEDDPGLPAIEHRVLEGGPPAHALHELARTEAAEVVVLGSTHRGQLGRIYPGSVAERLLSGSPTAVAVAPRGYADHPTDRLRVIEVGFRATTESQLALDTARRLAEAAAATLRVYAVHSPTGQAPLAIDSQSELSEALREAVGALPSELRAFSELRTGRATDVLLSEAEKGVDLLVLGSRGYGPFATVLTGRVAHVLLRNAPCPVLLVPRGSGPPKSP